MSVSARFVAEIIELARALCRREERCATCGSRVHRTRDDVLLATSLERYDLALASEWAQEAPTRPEGRR